MDAKLLADLVKKAADIREGSWDQKAYDLASEVDRNSRDFYSKDHFTAAREACGANAALIMPVYLLIYNSWNQSIQWSEDIMNGAYK